ncbi:MAG TPA: 50S ribosomal protein L25 [Candidatus Dormibacteraeota bacterium]|nr:50S ribosomal protein L25 [Candidatus Dormibacteraeota bacterium]
MDSLSLNARPRTETGRHVHHLRREGAVPAVIYGHKVAAQAIAVDAKEMERTWQHAGRTHLVDVHVEGQKGARKALIKDLQFHPRSGRMLHVDLFAVNLREKITSEVPVIVVGESPAVQLKLGQIQQVVSSLRVESLPADLPAQLTVDISGLTEVDQSVTIGEIELPKGVALVHADLGETVVKIAAVRVREELEAPEAAPEEGAEAPAAGGGEGGEGQESE